MASKAFLQNPEAVAVCRRDLSNNELNGSLSQAWASGTAFRQLKYLCDSCLMVELCPLSSSA